MRSVSIAELAILFHFDAVRVVLLVLLRDVIALFAICASQGHIYSHL